MAQAESDFRIPPNILVKLVARDTDRFRRHLYAQPVGLRAIVDVRAKLLKHLVRRPSLPWKDFQDGRACEVCVEPFRNSRTVAVLPCKHVVCRSCMFATITTKWKEADDPKDSDAHARAYRAKGSGIPCPFCRKDVRLVRECLYDRIREVPCMKKFNVSCLGWHEHADDPGRTTLALDYAYVAYGSSLKNGSRRWVCKEISIWRTREEEMRRKASDFEGHSAEPTQRPILGLRYEEGEQSSIRRVFPKGDLLGQAIRIPDRNAAARTIESESSGELW